MDGKEGKKEALMATESWRPPDWEKTKLEILTNLEGTKILDTIMERTAISILWSYMNSPEFIEDAKTYCREQVGV